jgi:hypothetical protein
VGRNSNISRTQGRKLNTNYPSSLSLKSGHLPKQKDVDTYGKTSRVSGSNAGEVSKFHLMNMSLPCTMASDVFATSNLEKRFFS